MIIDVFINDFEYNLNANNEKEQTEVLSNISALLKTFDINPNKQLIVTEDFNLLFNSKLDAMGGNPMLKKVFS